VLGEKKKCRCTHASTNHGGIRYVFFTPLHYDCFYLRALESVFNFGQGGMCISGFQKPVGDTANSYGSFGDSAALLKDGKVRVSMRSAYPTPYSVDLGVWVDDQLTKRASNIPALILSYIDHANCIYAQGVRAGSSDNVHQMSFRINKNQINLYTITTPNVPGTNAPWIKQVHYGEKGTGYFMTNWRAGFRVSEE